MYVLTLIGACVVAALLVYGAFSASKHFADAKKKGKK